MTGIWAIAALFGVSCSLRNDELLILVDRVTQRTRWCSETGRAAIQLRTTEIAENIDGDTDARRTTQIAGKDADKLTFARDSVIMERAI